MFASIVVWLFTMLAYFCILAIIFKVTKCEVGRTDRLTRSYILTLIFTYSLIVTFA